VVCFIDVQLSSTETSSCNDDSILEVELPDEVSSVLLDEDLAAEAKEALVMEFLREHRVSQGRAAEMLGINRYELFDLMRKYQVPVIDLTAAELEAELEGSLRFGRGTSAQTGNRRTRGHSPG
jgi:predicted HTH domain antitoxin